MESRGTTILVGDDHPIFREGMCLLVQTWSPEATILQAKDFGEVRALAQSSGPPDLFLLDLDFPGFDLRAGLLELRQAYPLAALVIVSMSDSGKTIDEVMAAGSDGFISKATSPDDVVAALREIGEGAFVVRSDKTRLEGLDPYAASFPNLTQRQRDVMKLIGAGQSNKEIARSLNLSPFTVRIHVSALLRQLDVGSRTSIAIMASKLSGRL